MSSRVAGSGHILDRVQGRDRCQLVLEVWAGVLEEQNSRKVERSMDKGSVLKWKI